MQTTIQGIVTGISKWQNAESGAKGGSLYMIQQTSGRNENVIGQEILKLTIQYEMFEEFREHEESFNNFGQFQVDADVEAGAQGRPRFTVLALRAIPVVEVSAPVVEVSATSQVDSKKYESKKPDPKKTN